MPALASSVCRASFSDLSAVLNDVRSIPTNRRHRARTSGPFGANRQALGTTEAALPQFNGVAINGGFLPAAAPLSHRQSRFLLHCNRNTAHGGRNFSADPDTTEL